jgi:hypothetical protein
MEVEIKTEAAQPGIATVADTQVLARNNARSCCYGKYVVDLHFVGGAWEYRGSRCCRRLDRPSAHFHVEEEEREINKHKRAPPGAMRSSLLWDRLLALALGGLLTVSQPHQSLSDPRRLIGSPGALL